MARKSTTSRPPKTVGRSTTTRKRSTPAAAGPARTHRSDAPATAAGKHLVIVESPAKVRTINKYLGPGYVVQASVGHVRDLPEKAEKAEKGSKVKRGPVPGVDLENDFAPTYKILSGKERVVSDLKRLAKTADDVWFATDLDREGEAIAWHLAHLLGIEPSNAKRVVFNAITKAEIEKAFSHPLAIDEAKVNAQQARRIVDRIVGYQVSPLLWKKVGRGLSAGRVQSVAVRLIVEREREIRSFIPDEKWEVHAEFTPDLAKALSLGAPWRAFLEKRDEKGNPPTIKSQNAWLAERQAISAQLVEIGGDKFELGQSGQQDGAPVKPADLTARVSEIARLAGLKDFRASVTEDEKGRGPARFIRTVTGAADPAIPWRVAGIETKRTTSRPPAPFITSTLQQAASSRLGFAAQRTMRSAQQLYEGVEIPGEGAVGLITYMRTDSTHLSTEAVDMARSHIKRTFGDRYLPDKPNTFASSNKAAQEAHEAVRPTSLDYPPGRVKHALKPDQFRLYSLIWDRFLACQMTPAQWDSTAISIKGGADPKRELTFRATGRVLVFDGFLRVMGVPTASDEQTLPAVKDQQRLAAFGVEPEQKFTSPPPRYTEASLIKMLESEGIGRPSTYASIIQVIQDRKYVEQLDRRFYATDLGEVVTDKLIEAFPRLMELGYTRDLEHRLDLVEEEHADWIRVLHAFYKPFSEALERAHEELTHAKAETQPAPKEYRCQKCGADLFYRFGKNGRFLSCSRYPKCDYACPVDREGKPRPIETANVACLKCGRAMIKRTGRFGVFYGCSGYPECDGIIKADKQGRPVAPSPPPLPTEITCEKCKERTLVLRNGVRGPWLSCSGYPKCRGRGKWSELPDELRASLEQQLAEHEKKHPIPTVRDLQGNPLTDKKGKSLEPAAGASDNGAASADGPDTARIPLDASDVIDDLDTTVAAA